MSNYKHTLREEVENLDRQIKIAIISSAFNKDIVNVLVHNNITFLQSLGFTNITTYEVPGAMEIPTFMTHVIKKTGPDIIFTFGAVVRGATIHFDLVSQESTRGVQEVSRNTGTPSICGILTLENEGQATERTSHQFAISGLNYLAAIQSI